MFAKLIVERDAALEQLKVYGRDPRFADPIFTREVPYSLTYWLSPRIGFNKFHRVLRLSPNMLSTAIPIQHPAMPSGCCATHCS